MRNNIYKLLVIAFGIIPFISLSAAEPTIWLIGDSTVQTYGKSRFPLTGWGQVLNENCKSGVTVINRAMGGRSTKSFVAEKRWEKVMKELKKGDYVFIQFGHNDQKKKQEKLYTDPDTTYREFLKKFIDEARSKQATPILVTPVCRRYFRNGKLVNTLGKYPAAMKIVAKETKTPVIDLNQISFVEFDKLGPEGTKKVFLQVPPNKYPQYPKGKKDNSHFCQDGARLLAGWIVDDAKKRNLEVSKLFK